MVGGRDTEELGGAVHRETADIQQHGSHLQGQRFAAWGRVGEVQAAGFAPVALLVAHQAVLDVLFTPTPLAAQPHDKPPRRSSSVRDISHLCSPKTLLKRGISPPYAGPFSSAVRA